MSQIEKDAKEVGKKIKKSPDLGFGAEIRDNTLTSRYGIDYFGDTSAKKHAQDTEIKAKALADIREIYDKTGEKNLQAHLTVTDKDVEAYKAFQDLEYLRDFDDFTNDKFLKGQTPAQVKWIHDLYPEIFTRRVEELDKILNVQKKVAMINIMGPRSKEDLLFMYELESMMKRDSKKYEAIIFKSVAQGVGVKGYTRGALNLPSIFNTYPARADRHEAFIGNEVFGNNALTYK